MRGLPLGLMFFSVIGMLMPTLAAAQNPCGYAFGVTGEKLYKDHCAIIRPGVSIGCEPLTRMHLIGLPPPSEALILGSPQRDPKAVAPI
jgi:hypothetical protein